ncbi:MAG: single-stranded DNA-binding protein [Candidatus Omnitrophica bacterium]|nr:single-stranded DNA-binding protein [Candidatus Omnitrophota bacterium]
MANLNKVLLIGNLTRDPELRYVPSGTAVVNFNLATNRFYVTSSGEKKQETCYVRVIVWGKVAETCGEYLSKGSPVFVEGRLQYRSWDGANGEKRSTLEVRAERVQFLGRGGKQKETASEEKMGAQNVEDINLDAEPNEPDLGGKVNNEDKIPF